MSAIELCNVTKRIGDVVAIDTPDLTVESDEIYGFLGPNGAGKITTINLLLDFSCPTAGSVEVLGFDARHENLRVRKQVGVLPEEFDVFDRLTGCQHFQFAAESKGVTINVEEIAERVGIADAIDRTAGGYSHGMAQRVMLGTALIGETDILILDEPLAGLDHGGAREIVRYTRWIDSNCPTSTESTQSERLASGDRSTVDCNQTRGM